MDRTSVLTMLLQSTSPNTQQKNKSTKPGNNRTTVTK